jgi:hypothetical protein
MEQLTIKILIRHLVRKGIEITYIPAFIRNVAYTMAANPVISLEELNNQLRWLGWNDVDLDDCTLQMILAAFETDAADHPHNRFDEIFNLHGLSEDIHERDLEQGFQREQGEEIGRDH